MNCILCYLDVKPEDIESLLSHCTNETITVDGLGHSWRLSSFQGKEYREVRVWLSGKAVCCSTKSYDDALRCAGALRQMIIRSSSSSASVVGYGPLVDGKAIIPVKDAEDYKRIFAIEAREIHDIVKRVNESYCDVDSDVTVEAFAEWTAIELVRAAKLDRETRELKSLIVDIESKELILGRLEIALQKAEHLGQDKEDLLDLARHILTRKGIVATIGAMVLGILSNAVFEFIVKPVILQFIVRHVPLRMRKSGPSLADTLPEAPYLTQEHIVSLPVLAKAVGKQEWDVMMTLNWLSQRGIVVEIQSGLEPQFKLVRNLEQMDREDSPASFSAPGSLETITVGKFKGLLEGLSLRDKT